MDEVAESLCKQVEKGLWGWWWWWRLY